MTGRHDHDVSSGETRFGSAVLTAAARLYYVDDVNQSEIAQRLGTSRATVSRMLSEARRRGIVRIDIVAPVDDAADELAVAVRDALGLTAAYVSPGSSPLTAALAPGLTAALAAAGLQPGDPVLVSSGRSIYEASRSELPDMPGVVVAPTMGGHDDPEAWYATNELTRLIAERVGGTPVFLYAPALPGRELYGSLREDPSVARVLHLWRTARCAILGVGAPLHTRTAYPRFVPEHSVELRAAVGDICGRFYDSAGREVRFPGSECLMAISFDGLRRIPAVIALAVGAAKVPSLLAGAVAGLFTHLVTDAETAQALVLAAQDRADLPARRGALADDARPS